MWGYSECLSYLLSVYGFSLSLNLPTNSSPQVSPSSINKPSLQTNSFFFFAFFIINIFFEREGASEREAERERGEGEKQGSPRGSCFTPSGVRPEVGLELTQLGAQAYPMWDLN